MGMLRPLRILDFPSDLSYSPILSFTKNEKDTSVSIYELTGAVELGLIYGLVAVAVYLSFRVLDFPDMTVDGSFPMGAGIAAILITTGYDPWLATLFAICGGALAGLVTASLNVYGRILHL